MAIFEYDDASLYYEVHGEGLPVLLLAPGGMRSAIPFWKRSVYDPIEHLSGRFRLIAMDQRNAGRSRAPVSAQDGWQAYTADQLALLDHLGVERFAVLGNCIGGSFALALMQAAPERVIAGVLQQPIGCDGSNRNVFCEIFDAWAAELSETHGAIVQDALVAFREHMYGGDFVFSVTREFVRRCNAPLLVLMGNDVYHPSAISREIASLAPNAELVEEWKDPARVAETVACVTRFLSRFAPG